jgi:hypothetical protein
MNLLSRDKQLSITDVAAYVKPGRNLVVQKQLEKLDQGLMIDGQHISVQGTQRTTVSRGRGVKRI